MEELHILYGTQTGNAERLALRISRIALQCGVRQIHCLAADEVPIEKWPSLGGPMLLISSNANQGDAPNTIRRTWAALLNPAAPSMESVRYAVFGVGDSLYMKFNYMAKMLHNRMLQLGGQPLLLRGLGDESDAKGVDEVLQPWLKELWNALGVQGNDHLGKAANTAAVDRPPFPLYRLTGGDGTSATAPVTDERNDAAVFAPAYMEPTFRCEVVSNTRLTSSDYDQNVRHLELVAKINDATAPAPYSVGDALGIYCSNRLDLVEELLQRLRLSPTEVVVVTPETSLGMAQQPRRPFFGTPMTLYHLLQYYFDLDSVASQDFFWMLSYQVDGVDEDAAEMRERLLELANPTNVDDYLQYAHREKRNVCEVLHDFKELNPPLDLVLSFLTPMLPRYFSIASAPALDPWPSLHLCVGQLEWKTPMGRHRKGLCSSFLASAAPGSVMNCFVWEGSLVVPTTPSPLLCIATGTGIAPLRALIRQCAGLSKQGWADASIVLIFGCRYAQKDYLYQAEWQALKEAGLLKQLRVIPAFSRDTAKKIYVQHQLGQYAKMVSSFLRPEENDHPGVVYVCGNAKQMPKDVQRTLEQILAATFAEDDAAASVHLRNLGRSGRYQLDTWSA